MTAIHCWEDGPEEPDGMSTTCLLPDGHDGPHEWARDDEFHVAFQGISGLFEQPEPEGGAS